MRVPAFDLDQVGGSCPTADRPYALPKRMGVHKHLGVQTHITKGQTNCKPVHAWRTLGISGTRYMEQQQVQA